MVTLWSVRLPYVWQTLLTFCVQKHGCAYIKPTVDDTSGTFAAHSQEDQTVFVVYMWKHNRPPKTLELCHWQRPYCSRIIANAHIAVYCSIPCLGAGKKKGGLVHQFWSVDTSQFESLITSDFMLFSSSVSGFLYVSAPSEAMTKHSCRGHHHEQ